MTNTHSERFLGTLHDCYHSTDPRANKDLAQKLNGKNVLIAGAGRGIGRACAEFFSYCSPKSVSLIALEKDQVEETARICKEICGSLGTKTGVFDVTDPRAVKDFVAEVDQEFGSIDVLLMNAGRPPQWLPVAEGDPDIWWDTVRRPRLECSPFRVIELAGCTTRLMRRSPLMSEAYANL
jgi:NAD(P)-dependent dehydrogenase (short-subunit alcohol dehydrogenase family)